jgi:SAM-dependent methyltransferase
LEVGCGAGRFTEWLVGYSGRLTCLDASHAVNANRANCAHLGSYQIVQGDINESPFRAGEFDVVICLGVVQHTPLPEETIQNLAHHLAPHGLLVIDHYTWRSRWSPVTQRLSLRYPLRAILRRVARWRPDLSLRITRGIVAVCDPIRRYTGRHQLLDNLAARIFPSNCYYATYTAVPPQIVREWNELDTHDSLTDWYKHQRTVPQIRGTLEAAGLTEIECWRAGNGVEARARRP